MHAIVAIQDKSMTAYTIFCADSQPNCALSADAPFVFTEGPKSFKYTGIAEPTLYVNSLLALPFIPLLWLSLHLIFKSLPNESMTDTPYPLRQLARDALQLQWHHVRRLRRHERSGLELCRERHHGPRDKDMDKYL